MKWKFSEDGIETTEPTYDEFVAALTSKPSINLDPQQVDIMHAIVGLTTESGELADQFIKKHLYYGKPLDKVNMVEELGDLEFYLSMLRQALGVSREEVLRINMNKLMARYPGGAFDPQRAINRDLAKERETLEGGAK
jgi:NTP pyrophosphatase (non-canonical NTP hydrolase)